MANMPRVGWRSLLTACAMGLSLGGWSAPAIAQAECAQEFQNCSNGCRLMGALGNQILRMCQSGCTEKRNTCVTAGRASPGQPKVAQSAPPASDLNLPEPVTLSEPLSSGEVSQRAAQMFTAEREHDAGFLQRLNSIPSCQGSFPAPPRPGQNAGDCLFARGDMQKRKRTDAVRIRMAYLQPLGQSMDLDLQRVNPDAVAQARGLRELRRKYKPLLDQRQGAGVQLSDSRPDPEFQPLYDMGGAAENKLYAAERAAYRHPDVRRAFARGDLRFEELNLSRNEQRIWSYDLTTGVLARHAREVTGSNALFMDRRDELEQSARESQQAAQFKSWSEPTANEMGLAVLRTFVYPSAKRNISGQLSGPYESRLNVAHHSYATRVAHVQKQKCAKQAGGYRCDLRLWMHGFLDSELDAAMVASFGNQGRLFNLVGELKPELEKRNAQVITQMFVPTQRGWLVGDLNTEWVVPKELEATWKLMGGFGQGMASGGGGGGDLNAIKDIGDQADADFKEKQDRTDSYQRDLMDRKCGTGRIC